MRKRSIAILIAGALLTLSVPSYASNSDANFTYIDLNASAHSQIPNDLMRVQLYIESTGDNPKNLGSQNTRSLNAAIDSLKAQGIEITSGNRVMSPHYTRVAPENEGGSVSNQPDGWTERVQFSASSSDFGSLSLAIAKLDGEVKMQGVSFSVSPTSMASEEQGLTTQALASFHDKARQIAQGMGSDQYSVISLNVPEAGTQYPIRPMMRMASMSSSESVGMATEGGKTTIVESISGQIAVMKESFKAN